MSRSDPDASVGVIFDVKRYAIHDGPGVRTTVFLMGCLLRCPWCHNPESWDETLESALVGGGGNGLPVGRVGRRVTVDQLVAEIDRDVLFHDESGGGVTFSGGEPLVQAAFLRRVLERLKALDARTALDTCCNAEWETLDGLRPLVDLFLCDVKHMDDERHREATGIGNERILENIRRLASAGAALSIRFPLIPGANDDDANVEATARFAAGLSGVERVDVLPYHDLATGKWRRFGLAGEPARFARPEEADLRRVRERMESMGLAVTVGG